MANWLHAVQLGTKLKNALAATDTHFVQPADNVLAAMDANSATVHFFQAFKFVLQSSMTVRVAIAVRYDDTPPTLESLVDPTSGVTIFWSTAIDNATVNLMHLGVLGQPDLDTVAAQAASIARFGPIGSVIVVTRTANAKILRCQAPLDGIIDTMLKAAERANAPGPQAPANAAAPHADGNISGRETALFLRSNQAKEAAVRRLVENLVLAPDHTGARQLFTNLQPTDAITLAVSGAYDMSAIIVRIRTMMRLAAHNIDKDEVKLTDDQWRRLLLLQDPPISLLNSATMLATDIGPDTFSDMAARAAHILGLVYGQPLDTAINHAGVALAALAKTDSAKALGSDDLFGLLSKRLTNLFASPLLYEGGATEAIRARPLADRLAEALRFTKDSEDYKTALDEAKAAAHRKELADLKQQIQRGNQHRPTNTKGQGGGKGDKKGTKRDRGGNTKVGNGPTDPAPNQAWRDNKPPGDHIHVDLPCFKWALNMAPCKNQQTCQDTIKRRHNPNWDNGLTAAQRKAYLAWFRTHPEVQKATGNTTA